MFVLSFKPRWSTLGTKCDEVVFFNENTQYLVILLNSFFCSLEFLLMNYLPYRIKKLSIQFHRTEYQNLNKIQFALFGYYVKSIIVK